MSRTSQRKGRAGELELVEILRDNGFDVRPCEAVSYGEEPVEVSNLATRPSDAACALTVPTVVGLTDSSFAICLSLFACRPEPSSRSEAIPSC